MKLLSKDKIEIRKAFFLEAFNRKVENMSIISFGSCNFNCSYCKRDGQFRDDNNEIINSVECSFEELKQIVQKELAKGNRIRLSGGDPCMYIKEALNIAKYVAETSNQKISIAHNGSCPNIVNFLSPYLDYVAIDLKSPYPDEFSAITGVSNGEDMIKRSLQTQQICTSQGILTDVRTCVFEHTTLQTLKDIANMIVNNNKIENLFWTIRCYNPIKSCAYKAPDKEQILQYIAEIKKIHPELKIGMRARWKGGFIIF